MESSGLSELKERIIGNIDRNSEEFISFSKMIWEYAEIGLEEQKSSKLLSSTLEKNGFDVKTSIPNLQTAFVASWGEGSPIIGFLAEYDALPGLSATEKGKSGHGCGHNLLGVASVASGISLKRMMEEYKISGTIRVYGCPSEETLYGKVIMASEKVFNDLDAALQWHPGTLTTSPYESLNALDNKIYRFYGKSAHASTPWEGKSALDAAQLFALGIEFAREHMAEKDKIHYVITMGGNMPNIIPDFAEVWVFIRSSDMNRLIELSNKVDLCAIGASLSTETSFEIERKIGCHLLLPNKKLSLTVGENLKLVGAPKLDEREKEFIDTRLSTKYQEFSDEVTPPSGWEEGGEWVGKPISTDVGDVSWIVPTNGMFNVSTAPKGVPYHNPDVTILSNTSIGFKGMLVAAKTLACTGIDLLTNQEILAQAKDEFRRRKELQKWNYEPLLPAKIEYPKYGWKPPIVPK